MCGEFLKRATLRNYVLVIQYQALIGEAHSVNVPHNDYKFNSQCNKLKNHLVFIQ